MWPVILIVSRVYAGFGRRGKTGLMSELQYLTQPRSAAFFYLYHAVREAEGRIHSLELLSSLPLVPADHPHVQEWRIRAESARGLAGYLKTRGCKSILELGCGNGWLSNYLAQHLDASVWGLDQNLPELEMAVQVFGDQPNLQFAFGDVLDPQFPNQRYDQIVLASCIQYFSDKGQLFRVLLDLLIPGGQIHLIDSPVYALDDLPKAQARSHSYYAELGFPEMADHYHPCAWSELALFQPQYRYRPSRLQRYLARLSGKAFRPFPWLVLERGHD